MPGPSPTAEPAAGVGTVEPIEEIKEIDPVDELDEIEPIEEIEEIDPVDELDEIEPIEEIEEIPTLEARSPAPTEAEVLEVVTQMLIDVIGPEYLIGLSIDLDTSFDADLELESLEFVALAERLLQHYGQEVDFVAWLATMELDEIIALTVGDLVSFIVSATSA